MCFRVKAIVSNIDSGGSRISKQLEGHQPIIYHLAIFSRKLYENIKEMDRDRAAPLLRP